MSRSKSTSHESMDTSSNEVSFAREQEPIEILKSSTNIRAKASAVQEAYTQQEPSTFFAHMCYATWGHKELANRCAAKTAKNYQNGYTPLTPKKKTAVVNHYKHFLRWNRYSPFLYQKYMGKISTFAHRAITNSRSHVKAFENIPEALSDEEVDEADSLFL